MSLDRGSSHQYKVSVDQYAEYHKNGFLKVPALLSEDDVHRLVNWADDILYGREDVPGLEPVSADTPLDELIQRFTRVHMLHRVHPTAEWGMLHPNVLDVLEALIGPDVLALQSMNFFNPPKTGGQGWHQDAFYIPTYPDTLIGAWIALDAADEENGCLWVAPGSHCEPIYPGERMSRHVNDPASFHDLNAIEHASHLDDSINTLSKVAEKYPSRIPVPMQPGDVLFFHSHLLHRSYPNQTEDRFRRSYVCHYCNAHSFVPWNHGAPFDAEYANELHILARGDSYLPYAKPAFGTPVVLTPRNQGDGTLPPRMMGMENGSVQTFTKI